MSGKSKQYYMAHREELRAKGRVYYHSRREENKVRSLAYYRAHKIERAAYRKANRDKINAKARALSTPESKLIKNEKARIRYYANREDILAGKKGKRHSDWWKRNKLAIKVAAALDIGVPAARRMLMEKGLL